MRTAIVALFLTALSLVTCSSGPTTPGAALVFAAEPVADPIPIPPPCSRYCNGTTSKYCGTTPSGNVGCDHIVNNFCVFTLCGKDIQPPQE